MIKITKSCEYALRTLVRLGLFQRQGHSAVSVSILAAREQVPFKFTENLLARLRLAGYVETVRGKSGGTRFAQPMSQIRLGDIVRLIDGEPTPLACVGPPADTALTAAPCTCPSPESCGLRQLMLEVHQAITQVLDKHTLEELVSAVEAQLEPPLETQRIPPAYPPSTSSFLTSLSPQIFAPQLSPSLP